MSTELVPAGAYAALEKNAARAPAVVAWAESLEVTTDEEATWAAEKLRELKGAAKKAEEDRTSISRPLNEALRALNALAKRVSEPLAKAEGIIKGKLSAYAAAREQDREDAMVEAAAGDPTALARTAPAAPLEGVTMREVWDFEVEDPNAVPREYCVVDPRKIREAMTNGDPRQIPGVRFFKKAIVSARAG